MFVLGFVTGRTPPMCSPNPLFPFGPPAIDPVPDSIHRFGGQFLVTLLSGFPFPPGVAQVRMVDAHTGNDKPFITGLTSAIDVLPVKTPGGGDDFLTLEFSTDQFRKIAAIYFPWWASGGDR